MRVAVTGATGFIGGAIARGLADDGHQVVALGRRTDASLPAGLGYRRWDLAESPPGDLPEVDAVVHAAAEVADWGTWDRFQAVTVEGTRRLLERYPEARLIVVGSASVYDPFRPHLGAREGEAPVGRYRNAYGRAKAEQERLVAALRPDALVLRPHAVYGPGDRTLLPRLLANRRLGRLLLPGGGRQPISITNVDAVVDAVRAGLARPDVRGPTNLADALPVTPRELLDALFFEMALPTRIVNLPLPVAWPLAHALEWGAQLAGSRRAPRLTTYALSHLAWPFTLDLSRAREELGLTLDRSFRDGLSRVAVGALPAARRRGGSRTAPDGSRPPCCRAGPRPSP
jgi:nucleoside-diphosphate-sugar epimerase